MKLLRIWQQCSSLRPHHVQLCGQVRYLQGDEELFWLDVPEHLQEGLSSSGNPWLGLLLPLAMHRGEPLSLPEPVDASLLQNAEQLQRIWCRWFPQYSPVRVEAEVRRTTDRDNRRVGCFLSGGVDSFFSFLRHEENFREGRPARPAEDLLCIWGFGVRLHQSAEYRHVAERLRSITQAYGRELLLPATNLRETRYGELSWGALGHGAALAFVGLALENRYSEIRVPASFQDDKKFNWGTHPDTLPLFSTAGLTVAYDGGFATRTEKTAFLARYPAVLDALHVCWQDHSDRNCGQCEKCLRTMITLELLGVRHSCSSFPLVPLRPRHVERVFVPSFGTELMLAEVGEFARSLGRGDYAEAIDRAGQRSRWIRRVSDFSLGWLPGGRIRNAAARRLTRLLVRASGGIGRV